MCKSVFLYVDGQGVVSVRGRKPPAREQPQVFKWILRSNLSLILTKFAMYVCIYMANVYNVHQHVVSYRVYVKVSSTRAAPSFQMALKSHFSFDSHHI